MFSWNQWYDKAVILVFLLKEWTYEFKYMMNYAFTKSKYNWIHVRVEMKLITMPHVVILAQLSGGTLEP